jgi:amidase
MNFLKFLNSGSTIFTLLIVLGVSCESQKSTEVSKVLDIHDEITIDEIQQAYSKGDFTVTKLTQFYLDRINSISIEGPELNAVLTINPDALKIASQLDEEIQNGTMRGSLHGIPILLKDNIDTSDKMPCTAGARAMKDSYPLKDSSLAAQLRKAGAVILGKANLSEWANFHSYIASSGWSGLGGQTKNPYDLSRNPAGSSSGSGVAVAANLCVLAIGTETNGSIVNPANNNGIVGIKPTVGLISRTGIIPISFSHDTGGPMARTVTDAAICLGALTDSDTLDNKTLSAGRMGYTDYTQFLKIGAINGKRIGYYKSPLRNHVRLTEVMKEAISYFRDRGAIIIELNEILAPETLGHSDKVMFYEFKDGLNKYLQNMGSAAQLRSLEDLIEKTFADSIEMKYHDHELLKLAQSKGDLNSKEYQISLAAMFKLSQEEGIDKVMNEHNLDAIIAPTGGPAWKTDLTNGDKWHVGSSSPAAIAGYPTITLPMGQIDGLPVGISIFGRAWSESTLLEIAYSYEQGTKHRMTPKYNSGQY